MRSMTRYADEEDHAEQLSHASSKADTVVASLEVASMSMYYHKNRKREADAVSIICHCVCQDVGYLSLDAFSHKLIMFLSIPTVFYRPRQK